MKRKWISISLLVVASLVGGGMAVHSLRTSHRDRILLRDDNEPPEGERLKDVSEFRRGARVDGPSVANVGGSPDKVELERIDAIVKDQIFMKNAALNLDGNAARDAHALIDLLLLKDAQRLAIEIPRISSDEVRKRVRSTLTNGALGKKSP